MVLQIGINIINTIKRKKDLKRGPGKGLKGKNPKNPKNQENKGN